MVAPAIIREATAADIDQILVLWHELMDYHIQFDRDFELADNADVIYRNFLQNNIDNKVGGLVLVVEAAGRLLGYGVAMHNLSMGLFKVSHFGEIVDFCITADTRGCGWGRRLYEAIDGWFKERNVKYVELRCSLFNELSNGFWRKMGFNPTISIMNKRSE